MTDEEKEKIHGLILDAIEDALEEKKIEEQEVQKIATFVTENIKSIGSHEALVKFLLDLSSRWPVFQNIYQVEQGKEKEEETQAIVDKAVELTKEGKIEEAINVARSANN